MYKPILVDCLQNYRLDTFKADLFAGLTVGVVALPLAMAFAIACGLPPECGLYTAIVAGFLVSLFGGSRFQVSGPTGAFVVIISAIYTQFGFGGLALATLLAGLILIALGLCQLGALIKFIPFPVVTGFTSGIAVVIFATQLKDIFGLQIEQMPQEFVTKLIVVGQNIGDLQWQALLICLATVVIIFVCRKFFPRWPAMLMGMLFGTALSLLPGMEVASIGSNFGELPRFLPLPSLPDITWSWLTLHQLAMPALTIALLAAIESLLSATVADGMTGTRHKPNTELIGQGIGNVCSVLFGGIPATGAIARTATNIKAGAQTPVAGLIHAVALGVIIMLFGAQAKRIPLAALAGIMVVVCYNMSEYRVFYQTFKGPKSDWSVMLVTFFTTVLVDLVVAVQVGLLLASLLFVRRMAESAEVQVISNDITEKGMPKEDPDATCEKNIPPGVMVFEVQGALFFGAVNTFREITLGAFRDVKPRLIVLRLRHVPTIDASGLQVVMDFVRRCQTLEIPVVFSGVRPQPMRELAKYGITAIIGAENVFANIDAALAKVQELVAEDKMAAEKVKTPEAKHKLSLTGDD